MLPDCQTHSLSKVLSLRHDITAYWSGRTIKGRTSFTPITVFTPKVNTNPLTVTMPEAIINAFPAYSAVLTSVLEMADTSSPTLGESSAGDCLIEADSDKADPPARPMCDAVVLLTRRGGVAVGSFSAVRNAVLRCLTRRTSGTATATVVAAN
jgi:hypothetical protein